MLLSICYREVRGNADCLPQLPWIYIMFSRLVILHGCWVVHFKNVPWWSCCFQPWANVWHCRCWYMVNNFNDKTQMPRHKNLLKHNRQQHNLSLTKVSFAWWFKVALLRGETVTSTSSGMKLGHDLNHLVDSNSAFKFSMFNGVLGVRFRLLMDSCSPNAPVLDLAALFGRWGWGPGTCLRLALRRWKVH